MKFTKIDMAVLLCLFLLAYFLRVMFLPQGALTFGYDQARDAMVTQQIISGDFKILGPPASAPGLYHGVFYYYFLVPAYSLSHNPLVAAYWTAFFNAATVVVVFYLTYLLTMKKGHAFLAALFFAVSFESSQYATWLSNPTLAVWTVPLIYLGLWAWISEKKRWGPVLCALGLGLSVQAEVFLLYHAVPVFIWVTVGRANVKFSDLAKFVGVFVLSVATMILVEVKFGFRGIYGVLSLLATHESVRVAKSLGDYLLLFLNQAGKVFAYSSYPGNIGYGGVLVLVLIYLAMRSWKRGNISWQPFLVTWLLSHISVVSMGGTSTPFLLVGIGSAVSILVGIFAYEWWSSGQRLLALFLIVFVIWGNLSMIFSENKHGQTIFSIQNEMTLSHELDAISLTYELSGGERFSINTVTSPLWVNNVWAYLYNWYGRERYGFVPEWVGKDQVGQLSNGMLGDASGKAQKHFLIMEPLQGIPPRFVNETLDEENSKYELVDEMRLGEIIVQERRIEDGK